MMVGMSRGELSGLAVSEHGLGYPRGLLRQLGGQLRDAVVGSGGALGDEEEHRQQQRPEPRADQPQRAHLRGYQRGVGAVQNAFTLVAGAAPGPASWPAVPTAGDRGVNFVTACLDLTKAGVASHYPGWEVTLAGISQPQGVGR